MRLRELRERYSNIASRLVVKSADANHVLSGQAALRIQNVGDLRAALEQLVELEHFTTEATAILAQPAVQGGASHYHLPSDVAQLSADVRNLQALVVKVGATLRMVAPDFQAAAGWAIRLPIGKDLAEVQASIDALEYFNLAIYTLTEHRLTFGGFDVGTHWVNVLLEAGANEVVATIVVAALKTAGTYAKESWEHRKALRSAQALGIATDEAELKVQQKLAEYLEAEVTKLLSDAKSGAVEKDAVRRVILGLSELARLLEHGGEIRGLITQGAEGPPARTEAPEPLQIEAPPQKFLPRKREGEGEG